MATSPISQTGFQGLRDGLQRAQGAATRIAGAAAGGDPAQVSEAIVDLQAAKLQAAAAVKVVETANQAVGTLIDILA